jgi:hypothetical protein
MKYFQVVRTLFSLIERKKKKAEDSREKNTNERSQYITCYANDLSRERDREGGKELLTFDY